MKGCEHPACYRDAEFQCLEPPYFELCSRHVVGMGPYGPVRRDLTERVRSLVPD